MSLESRVNGTDSRLSTPDSRLQVPGFFVLMRAVDIIAKKRDNLRLSRDEIRFVVRGYTEGSVPDYQMAALVMAVYLRGMDGEETHALAEEMLYSGEVVDFSEMTVVGGLRINRAEQV